jgi:signal transduction histidine kinase/DNA-binding response OmpR family regulator
MIFNKCCFFLFRKLFRPALAIQCYFFLIPLYVIAQQNTEKGFPFIINYLPKDYGASPQNWAIIEDDRGIMYFGNSYGLLEYDGVKWRLLVSGPTSIIRSLTKDKNGRIYYGSYGDFGYLEADSLGQTKMHSLIKFVPVAERKFNDVWTVLATSQGIYFQSRERIFRLQQTDSGATEQWNVKSWSSANKFMYAFYFDGIYYIHQQGIGLLKIVNDSLVEIPGSGFMGKERFQVMLPYNPVNQAGVESANKQYLLGGFYSGLYLYDGTSFNHFATEADSLIKNNTLYRGVELPDGSYALSTAGKGVVIIGTTGKIVQQLNRQVGLQDESVYAIYTDKKGTLWMALDNGISRIESASPFTQFAIQSGITTAAISINRFRDVLYTGTTNGLLRYNLSTAKFEQVKGVPTNQVFTLINDSDRMLVSTDGLYYVKDDKTGVIRKSVAGDLLVSALEVYHKNPDVIFAGLAGGIAIFHKSHDKTLAKNGSGESLLFAGYIPGVSEDVWSFAEDSDGSIWAGTQQGVLKLSGFADSTGNLTMAETHVERFGSADGLSNGNIHVGVANGKIYFQSKAALYRFDATARRFVKDNSFGEIGFGNDPNQYVMVTDYKGRIWLNFGKETALAIPKQDGSYSVEKTAFLPLDDHVIAGIFPEANGTVWFATTDGLIKYDENLKKNYDQSFKTLLRNVIAGKHQLPVTPSSDQQPSLDYNDNTLRFEYAAPFFEQENKTQYQTWLEGFEQGWSAWGNNTYKEYTNLPGGKYHFHVRSMNIYKKIGEEAVYTFTIQSPWYGTWWAFLLYIVALAGLIYLLVRYRTHKLHIQRRLLEQKILERTHEVQQQSEELMTVNQISKALATQLNIDDLIKLVGDQLRQLFKANIVYLALLNENSKIITFPYQFGDNLTPFKLGEGLTSKIILTGEPLLINKDLQERTAELGIQRLGVPAASYIGVPIPVDDEIIGVLSVQSTIEENRFAEKDQRLLSTIAAHVGLALRKARLFEEVKLAKMEAEAASKNAERANEAKSAFLSTVSHELRTPLTSVLGFAKIIRKRLEEKIFPVTEKNDPKTVKTIQQISENLNVVISEGERLTHLINDVLDLAKIEAGKMEWTMEPVNITEIVDRAIAATSALFDQKNLKLEKSIEEDLPKITGDADKLIQVVVNLLSNAIKFTEHGSVLCRIFRKDNEINVSITDTGIGIAKEDYAAVFEQFKQVGGDTLTDKPKGTGLGLPICKEIIEHHGGRIWLESEAGKGSTFSFALPVSKSPDLKPIHLDDLVKQLKEQVAQSKLALKGHPATILVVDDDSYIRSLLRQELGDAGYDIEEAADGKEALSKIRIHKPDLIILDIMMPEMNGFDVAAILKNDPQTMDIPIIVLSIVQDKARGYRIGVDRYLTKPIDTKQLFSEIITLLDQGKSKKKVMVVDEDGTAIHTLTDVLAAKGYQVVESDGKELVAKAIASQPDIIIMNSDLTGRKEIVQSLRFEKGLENVLFLIYQ